MRVERPLTAVSITDAGLIAVRDEVEAMGHSAANDHDWLSTFGRVAAIAERILHSAPIEPGYSGGPLFDIEGRWVGLRWRRRAISRLSLARHPDSSSNGSSRFQRGGAPRSIPHRHLA